jgi:hypothetical protein
MNDYLTKQYKCYFILPNNTSVISSYQTIQVLFHLKWLERELKSNTALITKSLPLNKNIGTLLFEPLQTKLG